MILNMEKLAVYCLSEDREKIISGLMKLKCMELVDAGDVFSDSNSQIGAVKKPADLFCAEQAFSRYGNALRSLSFYRKKDSLFAKKKRIQFEDYGSAELLDNGEALCEKTEKAGDELASLKSELSRLTFQEKTVEPWKLLDLPLELTETKECRLKHLIFTVDDDTNALEEELEKAGGNLFPVYEDEEHKYAVLICHKGNEEQVEEAVKIGGIIKADFGDLSGIPSEVILNIKTEKKVAEEKIAYLEGELEQLAQSVDDLKLAYDSLAISIDCGKVEEKLLHTEKASVLTGWIPEKDKGKIEKLLGRYDCCWAFSQPEEGEEIPILLKNNKLLEPFEAVTEMYSLPMPTEPDPTPLMAPFFFVFFGMMLSDAAYGLILVFGGLFMLKAMDLSASMQKMVKLLMLAGVSTTIFGLLFGGFFGDALTVVLDTFLGIEYTMPALINPIEEPITILLVSCGLGLVHLFFGMGIRGAILIKRGKVLDAIFDVGFWYMLIVGLILLYPENIRTVGAVMAVVGALGLLLTQGREKPTFIGKLIGGLGSLYNITGYLSDVLSYSRILALGLATAVISQVVNLMGSMPGKSIVGFIVFLAVFLIGHTLNLAINALGSFVHSSRLQYVEFFGKFYEGGGKAFTPLRANTKYTFVLAEEEDLKSQAEG